MKGKIITGIVALATVGTLAQFPLNNKVVEDSVYQGQVIDFGRKGFFWDTYEGSFALGGENRSKTGYFSLDEQARHGENIEELTEELTEAVNTGANVRVKARRVASSWPWRSKTQYLVYDVETIEEVASEQ